MEILSYFYHPDHASKMLSTSLGSSSWITNANNTAIQHFSYLPFGEDWVDQRNSSWNAPYTFSGKEKDEETGYGYFGARYYDSSLSIWLSVDPMSDKYPSMSPYNYCANNPVMLVDPDGRELVVNETLNSDGTRTINITYTAYIRNQSNVEISSTQMQGYIDRIKGSIESVYSGNPQDNTQTTVTTSVDIQILPEENIDSKRHIITIANLPDLTKGQAETNGMEMWLDVSLLPNSPTNNETGLCETSTNDTQNTLERTSAHEWGHNAGLLDISSPDHNIMIQSGKMNAGMTYNNNQINMMKGLSDWRNGPNGSQRSTNNTDALQRTTH